MSFQIVQNSFDEDARKKLISLLRSYIWFNSSERHFLFKFRNFLFLEFSEKQNTPYLETLFYLNSALFLSKKTLGIISKQRIINVLDLLCQRYDSIRKKVFDKIQLYFQVLLFTGKDHETNDIILSSLSKLIKTLKTKQTGNDLSVYEKLINSRRKSKNPLEKNKQFSRKRKRVIRFIEIEKTKWKKEDRLEYEIFCTKLNKCVETFGLNLNDSEDEDDEIIWDEEERDEDVSEISNQILIDLHAEFCVLYQRCNDPILKGAIKERLKVLEKHVLKRSKSMENSVFSREEILTQYGLSFDILSHSQLKEKYKITKQRLKKKQKPKPKIKKRTEPKIKVRRLELFI
eukprot:snap_masked-scaffold_50-processed-gene-1.34-mRNA-1 protein AED:1.00 eAED:1.00 QI:0/-1/0/0/-1/1/1/0/344